MSNQVLQDIQTIYKFKEIVPLSFISTLETSSSAFSPDSLSLLEHREEGKGGEEVRALRGLQNSEN